MADPRHLNAVVERVSELERRVAALEGSPPRTETSGLPAEADTGSGALDQERSWALRGLRERISGGSAVLFAGSVELPGSRSYVWQEGHDALELLEADWEQAADALAALGHPLRLKLLQAILNGDTTTAALVASADVGTTGRLYHHLRELVAAGWLSAIGRGRYDVPAPRVVPLLVAVAAARH